LKASELLEEEQREAMALQSKHVGVKTMTALVRSAPHVSPAVAVRAGRRDA
jgi:hypothetical protein